MCILDACCYCIFLDIGCMMIAALILVFRIIVIVAMVTSPDYKNIDFTDGFTAAHATIILAAIGCIIPIFLMWGVCTGSPKCVCTFITLEIVYVLVSLIWEMYFIITYYSKVGRFDHSHYVVHDDIYEYGAGYGDYDYLKEHEIHRNYIDGDLYWLAPLISILVEGYFLWVAYSYYRFLEDEYDDFFEPPVFYA